MNRRRWVIIGIIALAVVAVISLMVGSRVPTYQGKSVYDWMFAQKSSALESSRGLMAIGSNAVPYLAGVLRIDQTRYDRYEWVRSRAFQKFAERWNLGFTWRKPAIQVRRSSSPCWLSVLNPCAKAVLLIQGESPEACAVLEESITTEKNGWVRETMLGEIAQLGPLARPLLPALRQALNDSHRGVRHEAAQAVEGLKDLR